MKVILPYIYTKHTFSEKSLERNVANTPAVLVVVEGCVHVSAELLGAGEVPSGCPHALGLLIFHIGKRHRFVTAPVDGVLVKVLSQVDGCGELSPGRWQE